MIKLSVFLLLLALSAHAQAPIPTCEDKGSNEPPFYVSDTYKQGNLEYENFRKLENPALEDAYIPRGSLVHTPPELYELAQQQEKRVPIKVLNVNTDLEENSKKSTRSLFQRLFSNPQKLRRVKPGDMGYISAKSLKPAGEFTFFVKADAPVYESPSGLNLNEHKIKPKLLDDGSYHVKECCFHFIKRDPVCFQFHLIDILNADNQVVETSTLKGLGCGFLSNLESVPNQLESSMGRIYHLINKHPSEALSQLGVGELELFQTANEYRGRRGKTALIKLPINEETGLGSFNMRHYTPDDAAYSDNFIQPTAGCAFLRVAQLWEQNCQGAGCELQYGNMFHLESWGTHQTHDSGYCVDIRPFRKEDDRDRGLKYSHSRYDRERTKKFIEVLMQAGASDLIFGDRKLITHANLPATREAVLPDAPDDYWSYRHKPRWDTEGHHDDHIHVCFNPDDALVKKTCQQGLNKKIEQSP